LRLCDPSKCLAIYQAMQCEIPEDIDLQYRCC